MSSNGSSWTNVEDGNTFNNVTQGTWYRLYADLSSYENYYIEVYYSGTTAVRALDDVKIKYVETVTKYNTEPLCNIASVTYDDNGATSGSAPIDENSPYTLVNGEANVTVLDNTGNLEKTGHTFSGWTDGNGNNYEAGDEFTIIGNTILYARWTPNQYTVTWYANGLALESLPVDYGNSFLDEGYENDGLEYIDEDAEDNACNGTFFVGWYDEQFEQFVGVPTLLQYYDIVGIEITGDKNYYAVFATRSGEETWNQVTTLADITDGLYVIVSNGFYLPNTTTSSAAPVATTLVNTINEGVLEGSITSEMQWNFIKSNSQMEIRPNKENTSNYLYEINQNNGIRVSSTRDTWSFANNGSGTFSMKGTNYNRYCATYISDWRSYTSPTHENYGDGGRVYLYKYGYTYSNYTTFCPCTYIDIDGISDNALVWAGKNANADWNSTINWTRYYGGGYHLAENVPTSSNNVYIIKKEGCGITALPHITRDESCSNLTMVNGLNLEIAENHTLTINGAATFTSGIISGNVVFGNSASATGAKPTSHVDGKVTKNGSAEGFSFPTGSNGNLGKVEVTDGTATNVSVQYFSNPAGFGTNDLPRWWNAADMSGENPFNHVSNVEYWKISSTEAITADFVAEASTDMHFNSETAEEDRIPTNIQMAFYDNNRWTNVGGTAYISDNTLSITGVTIPASATRSISGNYTTFGSKSKSTILPIELVSFTAECNGNRVVLEWTTATERNNSYFVVERSDDAVYFTEIARLAGAGNSIEPLSYTYTDYNAHGGDNYYRLVQVDYDGTRTASEIVSATCHAVDGEPEVLVYPNPFLGDLILNLENFDGRNATVEIFDMFGRMLAQKNISSTGNSYQMLLNLNDLPAATYNVRVSTADFVINRKVVKN